MNAQQQLKQDIVCICRMLHRKNYLAATDGNVSVRLGDRLLTTPSGVHKGLMEAEQVITVDLEGRLLAGDGKPTSEIRMHLLAYELRPEVGAVVHAHLPYATACTLAGIDLLEPFLPEVVITLGGIPTAAYATPGTERGGGVHPGIHPGIRRRPLVQARRHDGGAGRAGRLQQDGEAGAYRPGRPGGAAPGTGADPLPAAEAEKLRRIATEHKGGVRVSDMNQERP